MFPAIRSISVRNLLSFGADTSPLDLRPLNVLIGPNGSGKSNLIEILSLIQSTSGDLMNTIREGGGISEWLWKGGRKRSAKAPEASIELLISPPEGVGLVRYKLAFTQVRSVVEILDERIEDELPKAGKSKPDFYFGYEHGRPLLSIHGQHRSLRREDLDPQRSILSQRKDPDQYRELTFLSETFNNFKFYRDWEFGINSQPRQLHAPDQRNDFLEENGSNLALMLSTMRDDPLAKKDLLKYLTEFYREAVDLNAVIKNGLIDLSLEERGGFTTPAIRMSDGTLRWLSLLTILLNPTPPPLVCIEEPELGLHPDIIPVLARLLTEAAKKMQIVVTTHSDSLVEQLTETAESVIVCEKRDGSTVLRRLEMKQLSKWLEDYSLGDLWRKGELGGTRW